MNNQLEKHFRGVFRDLGDDLTRQANDPNETVEAMLRRTEQTVALVRAATDGAEQPKGIHQTTAA